MKTLLSLILLSLAAVARAGTFASDYPPALVALRTSLEAADTPGIQHALDALIAIESSEPRERELLLYSIGYGRRELSHLPATVKKERLALLKAAQENFESVLKINPKNAEAHALLSSVLGAQIGFNPARAMSLGPKSSTEMSRALELGPANPRVLLLNGISLLHKPAEYGGSAEAAEQALRRAVALLDAEPAQRPWPNWGRAEAHVWLAQTLEKRGQREAAQAEYETAVRVAPASRFARAMLDRSKNAKP